MLGFGEYPPGYNREIHGPFDPSRYYGKRDTPFADVKLVDLPKWISRRSFNPIDWGRAASRAYWRWNLTWIQAKRTSFAGFYQFIFVCSAFFYIINYPKHRAEMNYKYH